MKNIMSAICGSASGGKKLLFAFAVIGLLAAGCNSSQQMSKQNTNPVSTTSILTQTEQPNDTSNCINDTYGYKLTVPQGWQIMAAGDGELREAQCNENLSGYVFIQNFRDNSHNQINLEVLKWISNTYPKCIATCLDRSFKSLDEYVAYLADQWHKYGAGTAFPLNSYGTISGQKMAWFIYDAKGHPTDADAYSYNNDAIYHFTFHTVDPSIQNNFIASFKFTK